MTPTRRWTVLAASVACLAAAAPAAHAQLGLPSVPVVGPLPVTETPSLPATPLDPVLEETVAGLQEQVDELLGTGELPADPDALAAAVQALNDLLANAPAGTDASALTSSLATLTESVNGLLGGSTAGGGGSGTPAVRPAPSVAAAIKAGSLSPAAAGSALGRPGRLTVVTKKLVVSKAGKAKLRVLCPITSGGCAGSFRTYSKLGRMKSLGGTVKLLRSGQAKTLTLRFGAKERRRLAKDRKVRVLVLSTYATRAVRTLKVSVRKR